MPFDATTAEPVTAAVEPQFDADSAQPADRAFRGAGAGGSWEPEPEPTSSSINDMARRAERGLIRAMGFLMSEAERALGKDSNPDFRGKKNISEYIPNLDKRIDPARDKEFRSTLAEGVGASIPTVAAAAVNPVLAPAVLATQMGGEERATALAQGETPEIASERAKIARLGGALMGALPGSGSLPGAGLVERVATRAVSGGAINAASDAALQLATEGKVDAERAEQAAKVGFVMGGAFSLPDVVGSLAKFSDTKTPERALKIISDEADKIPDAATREAVKAEAIKVFNAEQSAPVFDPKTARLAEMAAQPEASTVEIAKTPPAKLEAVQNAIKDPDVTIQYNVWDREMIPPGRSRVAQVDLPSPNAPRGGAGDGNWSSTNLELLRELGVDAPDAPEWLPPGRYTLEQVKQAIAEGPPPEAPVVGLGAASPAEFQPVKEFTTSMRNAQFDREAIARGLPPPVEAARKTFGATWDEAMAKIDEDQNVADAILAEVRDAPRPLKDFETAILAHRKIDLENQFNKATRNIEENIGTPDSLAADRATQQRVLDELLEVRKANRESGTELGRGLNIRKAQIAEDYSLATMMTERSVAKGGTKLTPEEMADVQNQHREITEAERALNENGATDESNKLQAKVEKAKADFDGTLERDRFEQLSGIQKLKERTLGIYDAARNLMTTGEFSFVLRQGKIAAASNPVMTAKALPKAFQALFGDELTARAIDIQTKNDPMAARAIENGVHFAEEGAKLSAREETLASKLADKLPGLRNFNQAGRVFLNKVRIDLYKTMAQDRPLSPEQGQALAQYVNEATGRGSLGGLEKSAVELGRVLFAPRYLSSRIQYLTGHSMWGGDLATRRIIAKEYAKTLVGLGVYYASLTAALSALVDDKNKEPAVTFDPRSSDFGKIRLGDTRLDPMAGLSQVIVFGARTATGEKTNTNGKVVPLRGSVPYGGQKWSDVATTFARSKLHPIPGAVVNLFNGTDLAGQPATVQNQAFNMVAPLSYMDIYEALEEQDLPEGVSLSLLALLGEGLQTYKNDKPKKQMGQPAPKKP